MSKSPNRGVPLYNSTTDSQSKFLTFRQDIAGESSQSAMMIFDKWSGDVDKKLVALEKVNPNILVNATWISQGYYEATTTEIEEYRDNLIITFRPNTDNDGTTILKINSLDVKTLMKYDNVGGVKNLDPRDLRKNHEYQFRYDGTRWVWQGGSSADQTNIIGDVDNLIMIDANNNLIDSGIDKYDITTKAQIKNTLTETIAGNILDASQGKILDDKIGVLTELSTTEKGNLVGAVNENAKQINVLNGKVETRIILLDAVTSATTITFTDNINSFKYIEIYTRVLGSTTPLKYSFDAPAALGNEAAFINANLVKGAFKISTTDLKTAIINNPSCDIRKIVGVRVGEV